jgi:hypothetical protein
MKGLNAQEERKQKIKTIIETIKEIYSNGEDLDENKFVFEIQQRYGCTEQKGKEYLKDALKLHQWEIERRIREAQNE